MTSWKKTFGVHICCSVLVLAFLVAVPVVATATAGLAEAKTVTGSDLNKDPLGRLPSSPEEAQERLAEKELAWPDGGGAEADFAAAGVVPGVRVAIPYDSVTGFITHGGAGADVKVELWRGVKIGEKTVEADANGWFKADMSDVGDILSGDVVRVTDLSGGPAINIDCTLTGNLDFNNDRVTGTASGSATIDAYIVAPSTYYADIPPGATNTSTTASAAGAFTAGFTAFNVGRGDAAFVFSTNARGDMVMNVAAGSGAGLVVYPQYDDVMGFYIPGTALQVQADAETRDVTTMGDGFFEAWFQDFDITDGTDVSCDMGGARSIVVRDVTATCDPATNIVSGTGPANRPMRITMDPYGTPVVFETTSDGAGNFGAVLADLYTATGTDVYSVTWYDDEGDCVVYEFQTFSWYLAEGYTGGSFDTYVLVQNPGPLDAEVVMTFQLVDGTAPHFAFDLAGGARRTVMLDALPGLSSKEVSTKVTSTAGTWIVAERAVYFDYNGLPGGHDSIGTFTPSNTWYLAEGYTGGSFDTYVLVQNPGTEAAAVTLSFQLVDGTAPDFSFPLAAGARRTVMLDGLPGLSDAEVSTKVDATVPVVSERACYFDYNGLPGGHDSIGVIAPSTWWNLAEGYTGGSFDTWVLVQNPGTEAAAVTLSFQLVTGNAPNFEFDLPGGERRSVMLDSLPGLSDAEVSTSVISSAPVVAERAMYFDYFGKKGGHDSIGATEPSTTWYLAEGYTGGSFDTWVLVQNPWPVDAQVTLSFQLVDGTAPDYTFTLKGGQRKSVMLDALPNLSNSEVSTKVTASIPVVSERAMYFDYFGKQGGHDSIGVPEIF
ncbi:MAG: hypothetical protein AB1384_07875 [Actinomycetota bacterium]